MWEKSHFERYANEGFSKVDGWCNPLTLELLGILQEVQCIHHIHGGVAEIGVHEGKLFIGLHNLLRRDERSLAIDVFEDQFLNIDKSGLGRMDVFMQNMRTHTDRPDACDVIKIDSIMLGASDTIKLREQFHSFRIFSIDGSHTLNHTIHDLLFAESVICNGGLVLIDDYYNPEWPEVHQAIAHVFINQRTILRPLFYQAGKLYLTTPAYTQQYKDAIVSHYRSLDSQEPIAVKNLYGHNILFLRRKA